MGRTIVECVPNFSEGRDPRTLDAIVNAIASTPGVALLGHEADTDHNRSVVTFAGAPQPVAAAAFRGIEEAVRRIDMSAHSGVHPRIGAADVVPFIPVDGATLEECVGLAHELGAEVWRRLKLPVYFYEAAARIEERRRLENVRRGGLPWLREHISSRAPDVGDPALHPTAGAVIIGARKFLIAFNINLNTGDVEIARSIARSVRESSGGLPSVKAIGVYLESRGLAQVSINLTDFEITGIGEAFDAVRNEAARHQVEVFSSEIIGLAPRRALLEAAATLLRCENFSRSRVFEDRLEDVTPLNPALDYLLDHIASPSSPTGGGSAAALSGAVAAALGQMVGRLSKVDCTPFVQHREFFLLAARRDAEAFGAVQASERSQESLRRAAMVPLEVYERAMELNRDLRRLQRIAESKLNSDLATAVALADAARLGGMATVESNLPFIEDAEARKGISDRLSHAGE